MNKPNMPEVKPRSSSCQNCDRLTEIEGEQLCFRDGRIIRLTPAEGEKHLPLLCEGWRKPPTSK
ncbi:hypothetical protein SHAM105786_07015 [Shewanella amazonensis]|uniref:Uncharacterized protein n=1 Tax=Shewanella amazonensis (strain ATCC BAA-1098 / SB2B) TaxID=326297 RepID=A1S3B3_SHEAM|nr:hypothetical protein [Shewanella amazonensis]ABL98869.1 conserved hypothetical protein [Shewanella amazonensis SB2B]